MRRQRGHELFNRSIAQLGRQLGNHVLTQIPEKSNLASNGHDWTQMFQGMFALADRLLRVGNLLGQRFFDEPRALRPLLSLATTARVEAALRVRQHLPDGVFNDLFLFRTDAGDVLQFRRHLLHVGYAGLPKQVDRRRSDAGIALQRVDRDRCKIALEGLDAFLFHFAGPSIVRISDFFPQRVQFFLKHAGIIQDLVAPTRVRRCFELDEPVAEPSESCKRGDEKKNE